MTQAESPLESKLLASLPYAEWFNHQPYDQNHHCDQEWEADQAGFKQTFPRVNDDALLRLTRVVTDADGVRRCVRRSSDVVDCERLPVDPEVGEATLFDCRHTVSAPNHEVRRFKLRDQKKRSEERKCERPQ